MKHLIVLALFISGCATTAKYEEALKSWVGSPEESLISQWGPPTSSYSADDTTKYLTYMNQGNSSSYYDGYGSFNTVQWRCKTIFRVDSGKISSWGWEGNNCRAR